MRTLFKLSLSILVTSLAVNCFAQAQPNSVDQIEAMMKQTAEQMNLQLPRKVDDMATLLKVDYDSKTISYFYRIDDATEFRPEITNSVITRQTCKTPQTSKLISQYGFSYRYNYIDFDGKPLLDFTITQATCKK